MRQGAAANSIDNAGPPLAEQGSLGHVCDGVAFDDLGGAEAHEFVAALGGASRGSHHLVPESRQQVHGGAPDTTRCPGDEHGALSGSHTGLFELVDSEHRSETGGADCHRLARTDAVGHSAEPLTLHPCLAGVAAPPDLANSKAGEQYLLPGLPAGGARLGDGSREVDAADVGVLLHETAAAGKHEAVLVVERRVVHVDRDVACGQSAVVEFHNLVGVGLVDLAGEQCSKAHGVFSSGGYSDWVLTSAPGRHSFDVEAARSAMVTCSASIAPGVEAIFASTA